MISIVSPLIKFITFSVSKLARQVSATESRWLSSFVVCFQRTNQRCWRKRHLHHPSPHHSFSSFSSDVLHVFEMAKKKRRRRQETFDRSENFLIGKKSQNYQKQQQLPPPLGLFVHTKSELHLVKPPTKC